MSPLPSALTMARAALAPAFVAIVLLAGCDERSSARADRAAEPKWDATAGTVAHVAGDARQAHMFPMHAMASDVEVLSGDPEAVGKPFVIRIRELPGSIVPPHTHPVDENITVVQGTWYFGTGPEMDRKAMRALPAGSYAFAPAGTTMFGYAPHGAIVQVHGIGPFHIFWKHGSHSLADADAAKIFRFHKGDTIRAPLGTGRILDGYASGPYIEYEVQAADGKLFMAEEKDIQRP
jgi:quercetin dioxygenase-like cupin family protein